MNVPPTDLRTSVVTNPLLCFQCKSSVHSKYLHSCHHLCTNRSVICLYLTPLIYCACMRDTACVTSSRQWLLHTCLSNELIQCVQVSPAKCCCCCCTGHTQIQTGSHYLSLFFKFIFLPERHGTCHTRLAKHYIPAKPSSNRQAKASGRWVHYTAHQQHASPGPYKCLPHYSKLP